MTFKETLLATIEDNRLEMLIPSREYSEEERVYMRGYNQALEDMLDDYNDESHTINHDKYTYSLN
jgi:hypothetical protein|tara:strand:- start:4069 stop:4263 length:195 start_codon:yes stop_codon:yes gene_type:complete